MTESFDCVRAAVKKEDIIVRNPHSTRPYQHVLEPLAAYLMIAKEQYSDKKYAGFYNVGLMKVTALQQEHLLILSVTSGRRSFMD